MNRTHASKCDLFQRGVSYMGFMRFWTIFVWKLWRRGEACARSAVTVSGDPSTRCQCGLRKSDPINAVSGDPSLGFRFRVQSLRRNSAVAYNILWATRAVGERGAGGWRGGGRAAEFVKPNKVRRSNPSQV